MDHDRGREFRKKKYSTRERDDKQMKRPIILLKSKDSNVKTDETSTVPQTILLKTRDGEKRAVSPQATSSSKTGKDNDASPVYHLAPRVTAPDLASLLPATSEMKSSVKLIAPDTLSVSDSLLDYLTDSTDFLVIGCLGYQSVGKSTIMSKLANLQTKEAVFHISSHPEESLPGTEGIDALVTPDRIIFLDTEPLLSFALLNRKSEDEVENELEILSLEYAGLLFSVCHIVLLIQDSELDTDLIRFLHVAEMLKPSVGLQADDETSLDYFPYLVFLHNKTDLKSFSRHNIKFLQERYKATFAGSQLPITSGIGIGTGSILRSLTPELCGEPVNLFLLPHFDVGSDTKGFSWNIQYEELLKKMRLQLLSLPPMPFTHTVLSEKNWWHYTVKMWEDIKKSNFYTEYGRLLPSQTSAKMELGNS